MQSVHKWKVKDVGHWLKENGFSHYTAQLCNQHQIDGPALLTLTERDLKEAPMQLKVLGDIKRLIIGVHKLQLENRELIRELPAMLEMDVHAVFAASLVGNAGPGARVRWPHSLVHTNDSELSVYSDLDEQQLPYTPTATATSGQPTHSVHLQPEYIKCLIGFVYMFFVFLMTAFVMVIVHDRVPDMKKYPPLPDIVLDNMPYVPWAFQMCEACGMALFVVWAINLCFHKHRFIIMRRTFSLTGSVFLLRCFTMLITSLSVPGAHLDCQPSEYGDMYTKLLRAFEIWTGCGMSLQGVRSCGDYMFSGHTVIVTTLNFFITEYTPRRLYWLHTSSWVVNIFAIFFILAAHEHYSIDVFIAFYITSRLFLYYHSLANNRALLQQDCKRMRIWFPLFYFFESKCSDIVPNEYEWPLPCPSKLKALFCHKQKSKLRTH